MKNFSYTILIILIAVLSGTLCSCDTLSKLSTSSLLTGTTISTPHRNLEVTLQNTEMAGKRFILEFTLVNRGDDIEQYDLHGCFGSCELSKAFDNLGNECRIDLKFGNKESQHGGAARNSLLKNVPVKVTVFITGMSSNATSFSQIKIKGVCYDYRCAYPANGDFDFRNIPIVKQ